MKTRILPNGMMMSEVADLISEGREVIIVPKGASMLPFIRGNVDKVTLVQPTRLCVGNIVLAHFDDRYVLHRIIAIQGDQLKLMGDGNLEVCEHCPIGGVIGLVTDIITPEGRHRKPTKGRLWRKLLPIRKQLLKVYRKWHKLTDKYYSYYIIEDPRYNDNIEFL